MIYIGTDCVATRMYELSNIPFNNPFCWGRITYTDFKKLITNWENIDFNHINIQNIKNGKLVVDGKITVLYTHYKYDKNYQTPTKKDINVFSNKIYSYIFEKYYERLQRMEKKDNRMYILHQKKSRQWLCDNRQRLFGFHKYKHQISESTRNNKLRFLKI